MKPQRAVTLKDLSQQNIIKKAVSAVRGVKWETAPSWRRFQK
jgi:hypothetical protein